MSAEKPSNILSLAAQLGKFEGMKGELPPVQQWHPELSGDMDMVIKEDGSWLHEGDPILREKLVRLFSTILKREGDEYFLVTPIEKWRIKVEATPFQVVLAQVSGEGSKAEIQLITNVGDEFQLNKEHVLVLGESQLPEVEVRNGLKARLSRNVYYELADLAKEKNGGFYLHAGGVEHQVG